MERDEPSGPPEDTDVEPAESSPPESDTFDLRPSDSGRATDEFARRLASRARSASVAEVRDPDFPAGLRGYDREAVDAYVVKVTNLMTQLETRIGEVESQVYEEESSPVTTDDAVKRALEQVGEQTSGILVRARETADEITARARTEAADRLEVARRETEGMVRQAEERLHELDADLDAVWQERTALLDDVRHMAARLTEAADAAVERFPPEEEDPAPGVGTPVPGEESPAPGEEPLKEIAEALEADELAEQGPAAAPGDLEEPGLAAPGEPPDERPKPP